MPFVLGIREILPFQICAAPQADSHKFERAFAWKGSYKMWPSALVREVKRSLDR
jgi:hypothetical protein